MTREQWQLLQKCAQMEPLEAYPVALIVDSPWVPGYLGIDTLDYMTDLDVWWKAQQTIRAHFPTVIFVPDYWVEFGMAAEPSGFGCVASFYGDRPPTIRHAISSCEDMAQLDAIPQPNPEKDGLMALAIHQYRRVSSRAQEIGEPIKIVPSRGPLNVAAHIMGVTEFLMAAKLYPDATHKLLKRTTLLVKNWLEAQAQAIGTVEGLMLLDDIIGFFSEEDFLEFAYPYLKEVLNGFSCPVKILHNDTHNPVSYPYLQELGFNIFNFTHEIPLSEARDALGGQVCLMGNVPPLGQLANGTPESIGADLAQRLDGYGGEKRGLIVSAGGGVSPGTGRANIDALVQGNP